MSKMAILTDQPGLPGVDVGAIDGAQRVSADAGDADLLTVL